MPRLQRAVERWRRQRLKHKLWCPVGHSVRVGGRERSEVGVLESIDAVGQSLLQRLDLRLAESIGTRCPPRLRGRLSRG